MLYRQRPSLQNSAALLQPYVTNPMLWTSQALHPQPATKSLEPDKRLQKKARCALQKAMTEYSALQSKLTEAVLIPLQYLYSTPIVPL